MRACELFAGEAGATDGKTEAAAERVDSMEELMAPKPALREQFPATPKS
jgi:hypothetical protein